MLFLSIGPKNYKHNIQRSMCVWASVRLEQERTHFRITYRKMYSHKRTQACDQRRFVFRISTQQKLAFINHHIQCCVCVRSKSRGACQQWLKGKRKRTNLTSSRFQSSVRLVRVYMRVQKCFTTEPVGYIQLFSHIFLTNLSTYSTKYGHKDIRNEDTGFNFTKSCFGFNPTFPPYW